MDAFTQAVYHAWQAAGAPPEQDWALSALGAFGNGDAIAMLNDMPRPQRVQRALSEAAALASNQAMHLCTDQFL